MRLLKGHAQFIETPEQWGRFKSENSDMLWCSGHRLPVYDAQILEDLPVFMMFLPNNDGLCYYHSDDKTYYNALLEEMMNYYPDIIVDNGDNDVLLRALKL